MRIFYSGLFYTLLPFIFLRLLWRGIKAPAYRKRWNERLGFYPGSPFSNVVWFHAVSVGEAESVFQLVKCYQNAHPDDIVLITTTTPTGSARVKAVMGAAVEHVYLPYDIPSAVARFMGHFRPKIAVIMETEIWPNLFYNCGKNKIPLLIVNARLSDRSARGYQKLHGFFSSILANVNIISTQSELDKKRFIQIGAKIDQVITTGNIKFDLDIPDDLIVQGKIIKNEIFSNRQVWIIASTHKNEEQPFLDIYKRIKSKYPDLLLVIVPRHPERFNEVANLCQANQLEIARRSQDSTCTKDTDVYIADTMGELKKLYAAADIAFVGGSLVPVGGHNVLEPAAIGIPVMFGPYMSNFKEIEKGLLSLNAAVQCANPEELENKLVKLLDDQLFRQQLIDQAKHFVLANSGATRKNMDLIEKFL